MNNLEAARIMMSGSGGSNIAPKPDPIIQNGTYLASDDDLDGYSSVEVDVDDANLGSVTFVANGRYTPTEPLDGWNEVEVDISGAPTLGDKYITQNGTYEASADNYDGYYRVRVNVPEGTYIPLTATENTTYTAPAGTGYTPVTVDVPTYYDEWQAAIEQLEHMQECCGEVVAALQKYDPDFDPEDCEDIPPEIDDVIAGQIDEFRSKEGCNVSVNGITCNVSYAGIGDAEYYALSYSNPHAIPAPELSGVISVTTFNWFGEFVEGTPGQAVMHVGKMEYNGNTYYFAIGSQVNPWSYGSFAELGLRDIVFVRGQVDGYLVTAYYANGQFTVTSNVYILV